MNLRPLRRGAPLTARERQVVQMVIDGRFTKQIAHELGISTRTVELHTYRARHKMGARNIAEMVRITLTGK